MTRGPLGSLGLAVNGGLGEDTLPMVTPSADAVLLCTTADSITEVRMGGAHTIPEVRVGGAHSIPEVRVGGWWCTLADAYC